jgi:hypothetical protein
MSGRAKGGVNMQKAKGEMSGKKAQRWNERQKKRKGGIDGNGISSTRAYEEQSKSPEEYVSSKKKKYIIQIYTV